MAEITLPLIAAWANAAFLGIAGMVNWFDGERVREFYRRSRIPVGSYRTVGLIEITAATFLTVPHLRAWGIVLAAVLLFGTVVVLLGHRAYFYAVLAILMLAALGAAAYAIPTYEAVRYAGL